HRRGDAGDEARGDRRRRGGDDPRAPDARRNASRGVALSSGEADPLAPLAGLEADVREAIALGVAELDGRCAALAQLGVSPFGLGEVLRTERERGDADRAVGMLLLGAARYAEIARREVLDEEGERWHEHRGPPLELGPVRTG